MNPSLYEYGILDCRECTETGNELARPPQFPKLKRLWLLESPKIAQSRQ